MYGMRYALCVMRHASCFFCESICTYIQNALKLGIHMYVMRYALCAMRQKWRLLKCSRVNPYVRMRIRFSNSCASDKLDRSVSRFMRHPIEKTDGEFQGMTSPTGCFPDKVCMCVRRGGRRGGRLPSIQP